jgi:hypothetical protein
MPKRTGSASQLKNGAWGETLLNHHSDASVVVLIGDRFVAPHSGKLICVKLSAKAGVEALQILAS